MNHACKIFALAAFGLTLALPAQAVRPTYSFVELGYLKSDYGDEADASGARFNFNVSLERWVYFIGEYNHANFDANDLEQRDTSLGFGTHTRDRDFQLFTAVTYERAQQFPTPVTDEGYAVQLGARYPILHNVELGADAKWTKFSDALFVERHRGTLQYRFGPRWAAVATYQSTNLPGTSIKDWTLGFRRYFFTQYDLQQRRTPSAP